LLPPREGYRPPRSACQVQEQQKQIESFTARLKEQAAQIQKVSARIEVTKPAPQVVDNNQ
jgi:hypothetical protein